MPNHAKDKSQKTPKTTVEEKKRKLNEILTPPGASPAVDFVTNLSNALSDPGVRASFKEIVNDALIVEVKSLRSQIKSLERRVEDLEQYSRRSCVKVSGFPESVDEKSTDSAILKIAAEMQVPLKPDEISRSHRLPSRRESTRPRDIVVRFTTYNKRRLFLSSRSKLKGSPSMKGSVYINEHLTRQRSEVFYQCRKAKKAGKLLDTWSYDGRIMVKLLDTNSGREIKRALSTMEELNDLLPDASASNSSMLDFNEALAAVSDD